MRIPKGIQHLYVGTLLGLCLVLNAIHSSPSIDPSCPASQFKKLRKTWKAPEGWVMPDFVSAVKSDPSQWKPFLLELGAKHAALPADKRADAWKRTVDHFISTVVPLSPTEVTRKTDSFIFLLALADLSGAEKSEFWEEYVEAIRYEVETSILNSILKRVDDLDEARRQAKAYAVNGFHSEPFVDSGGAYVKVGNDGELLILEPSGAVYLGKSSLTSFDVEKILRNRWPLPVLNRTHVKKISVE